MRFHLILFFFFSLFERERFVTKKKNDSESNGYSPNLNNLDIEPQKKEKETT